MAFVFIALHLSPFLLYSAQTSTNSEVENTLSESESLSSKEPTIRSQIDTISIYGDEEISEVFYGGDAGISKRQLENTKATDIHQVLKQVPGVYIQEEDGSGLRPNIGFRGVHPHRSKKITLMEDGILLAPAPYSSPAAYYFPVMDNINGIEVFKGPSSTKFGPNSIGGSLNLKTRSYFDDTPLKAKFALGSFAEQHADIAYSQSWSRWKLLAHATYLSSEGFKVLPNGDHTGFQKINSGVKIKREFSFNKSLEFKFNYAGEDSAETYLGITREDFARDFRQRYSASQDDRLLSHFRQFQIKYQQAIGEHSIFSATAYNHSFDRLWSKFESFSDKTVSIADVLYKPTGRLLNFLEILKGRENSSSNLENVVIGNNDRSYLSRGLQLDYSTELPTNSNLHTHHLDVNIRLHYDSVERRQTKDEFAMTDGELNRVTPISVIDLKGQNEDRSLSKSAVVGHFISFNQWDFVTNLRFDSVESQKENFINNEIQKRTDTLFTPGLEIAYNFTNLRLYTGIHRGMSPVGPGQDNNIKPEESLNYQLGIKTKTLIQVETTAFLSQYSNIVSLCTFASGCSEDDVDRKFNGGAARIYGLEMAVGARPHYKSFQFPIRLSSTYTQAEFASVFSSDSEEWGVGLIQKGDPLPYIPNLQTHLSLGLQKENWLIETTIKHQTKSYDQALSIDRKEIAPYGTVDVVGEYKWKKNLSTFLRGQNIFNKEYVTSFRPLGARPGRPQTFIVGTNFSF